MSQRHVEELMKIVTCLFRDALAVYPTLEGEFEKDLVRLQMCVEQRGIHCLTVDLPAAGKHLDRCLSKGQYKFEGVALTKRVSSKVRIPKFLRGLYLLVFDTHGRLRDDCDTEAVLFLRQLLYVGKKAKLYCGDTAVRAEVRAFCDLDESLPQPEPFWDDKPANQSDTWEYEGFSKSSLYQDRLERLPPERQEEASIVLTNLDKVTKLVSSTLGDFSPDEWRFRHGPGAISQTARKTNKYTWYSWSERLESVFPIADHGFYSYSSWAANIGKLDLSSDEPWSRLIDVPKTYTKPRLIAAEPSEHQWCQQSVWNYFDAKVHRSWLGKFIRFRDQTYNQMLCTRGSEDGSLATIDLSAASDRVTCHIVGQTFRTNLSLLFALQASRTRRIRQSQVMDRPEIIVLRKFSTMGSACTFPVQSLVFLSIVISCVLTKRQLDVTQKNINTLRGEVAVFGDDLIVPEDSRELVSEALDLLQFKVNTDKSFWEGNFRESCGVDSFRGENVTPTYWSNLTESAPESIASAIDVANNFQKKFLLNTSDHVASTLRKVRLPNVAMDSGIMGLKSFSGRTNEHLKTRWNESLQRMESLVPVLIARVKKTPADDDSGLLQYFTEDPDPTDQWESGVAERPELRMKRRWVPNDILEGYPSEVH